MACVKGTVITLEKHVGYYYTRDERWAHISLVCAFVCVFFILYEGVHNIIKQCVFVHVDFLR